MGIVNGKKMIFFGGGDGICYGLEAASQSAGANEVEKLKMVWRFDCDPEGPKQNIHQYMGNRQTSASNIKGMPVFANGRIYVAAGGDFWWGKRQSWLKCVDPTKEGDVTNSAQIWSFAMPAHCIATPAVYKGMVFTVDSTRQVHCLDADTGKPYWTHKVNGEMWSSPLIADGKLYIGTRKGDFWILAADKEKRIISQSEFGEAINGTATAANGVLFVSTMTKLYAFAK
jgi:outer membrane protein assembly factor BamB